MSSPIAKFENPTTTLDGKTRATVDLKSLDTLWFNTGTQCNLSCTNCYIESSPQNDRLVYLTVEDVEPYLDEIEQQDLQTREIGFTGGEPFLNPNMIPILQKTLTRGFDVLVLTNAFRMINRYKNQLLDLKVRYGDQLTLRVSLDHYRKEIHESERGVGTFDKTLENIQWLDTNGFRVAIAGRALVEERTEDAAQGYRRLLEAYGIDIDYEDSQLFVVFPEMEAEKEKRHLIG